MGALWASGDNMSVKRRNREAIIGRLLMPLYDIDEAAVVRVAPAAIDGDYVTTTPATHWTVGSGVTVAVLHSITLVNSDTATRQATVHIVQSGGSPSVSTTIFADTLEPGDKITLTGPWFLDPSDTLRSVSSDASSGQVGLRAAGTTLTGTSTGLTLKVVDGLTASTSLVSVYACPGSGVQHANVLAITITNTDTGVRTAEVQIMPSGGSDTAKYRVFYGPLEPGESTIVGSVTDPILLEPGDGVSIRCSTGSVIAVRVSVVEFT